MMAAHTNRAFWQDTFGMPGTVRESPLPKIDELGEHQVLVKVHAWAINPCDHMLQDQNMGFPYPVILGCDVAGTVEAVSVSSAGGSKFRVGDRVFGFTANNGFQDFVVLDDRLIAGIPAGMPYREPVVLGLTISTSAMLLFGKDYLRLDYPKTDAVKNGKSVLVWGGSSSVGSNAIQLVTAAGYNAITTCSRKNFDYVKSLGAIQAFDYKDPDVTEKVAAELDKGECAGIIMAAGLKDGNVAACQVAAASKKQTVPFSTSNLLDKLEYAPKNVEIRRPPPGTIPRFPDYWFETTAATFGGYLPNALAKGTYKAAPAPLVVNEKGLDGIQEAIDCQRLISQNGQEGFNEVIGRVSQNATTEMTMPVKLVVERA
ncbi:chaperonin 10-like protein [Echria macrotheca]|uniref:Chaperonin 10-like protein n=1 Tax=Echria macrotheca TaxID=438768 RepID=A0AAJ0BKZ8_9PEZI|nr:chaperonin 10-like protein [Echria macrotheca]